MNAYAVVYRNEGREAELERIEALIGRYWDLAFAEGSEGRNRDTPESEAQNTLDELTDAIAALSQPYTLHTLCKTPECAVESVSPFEGAEVFGMATIAVESELVSGMRFRLRAKATEAADEACDEFEGRGHITTYVDPYGCGDVSSPEQSPCPECAPTLREAAAAGIEGERG